MLCDDYYGNSETERVGALGTILPVGEYEDVSDVAPSPLLSLNDKNFKAVKSYINSTR